MACICSGDTCIIFFWLLGVTFFKGSNASRVGTGAGAATLAAATTIGAAGGGGFVEVVVAVVVEG